MTTFTWSFPQFDVVPSEDGLTDVVKTIHWRYDAVDGEYAAGAYGTVGLGEPNPTDFIPYDQLTEAWAINAVSASINVPEMQAALEKQIADEKNPPIVPMAPPWQS
jgi:hypothetical protein